MAFILDIKKEARVSLFTRILIICVVTPILDFGIYAYFANYDWWMLRMYLT